jgi:hypothetical protein
MTAKLRDHPLMKYRGVPTWPPVWTQERFDGIKKMKDEVGVLIYVHTAPGSHRCYLIISYENENYAGTLLFDSARFCQPSRRSFATAHRKFYQRDRRFGCEFYSVGLIDRLAITYVRPAAVERLRSRQADQSA